MPYPYAPARLSHRPKVGPKLKPIDVLNLRQWLHRIDEQCSARDAAPKLKAIREAALSALRGEQAPAGFALPTGDPTDADPRH